MPALISQSSNIKSSLALILAVVAIFVVIAMRSTPCAYAASGSCSVGDLEVFTSAITVNEDGNDADTRFEGDTEENLWYLDAGNDAVILGASAPDASERLRVNGDARIDGNLLIDTVAKGGILGGTAADTLGVLAVGANDLVLTADSGESTGMKWAAVATFLHKTADETVNNNNTLQDDDDLTFSVEANKNYAVWGSLIWDSAVAADIQFQWSVPAGAIVRSQMAETTANFELTEASAAATSGLGAGTLIAATIMGTIVVDSNAGTAVLQWAQLAADGSDTKVRKGSWLAYKLLN